MEDPKTEQWLNKHGFRWEYRENVAYDEIDEATSRENVGRVRGRFNQQRVDDYAANMAAGDRFPAIVCYINDNGKLVIATGWHRWLAAKQAKFVSLIFGAYVVREADPLRRLLLSSCLNSIEGQRDDLQQRYLLAVDIHRRSDMSVKAIAHWMSVESSTLNDHVRAADTSARAISIGVDLGDKLQQGVIIALGTIVSDTIFKLAVGHAKRLGLSVEQVKNIVREINKVRSKGEQPQWNALKKCVTVLEADMAFVGRANPGAAQKLVTAVKRFQGSLAGRSPLDHQLYNLSALSRSELDEMLVALQGGISGLRSELDRIAAQDDAA